MRLAAALLPLTLAAAVPAFAVETVPTSAFRSIELRGGGNVLVRPGRPQVTILEGSTQFTRFHVDGQQRLVIDACNDRCPRHYDLTIEVRYPTVLPMGVSGGGTISVAGGFGPQNAIAAGVEGGGTIDIRSVGADTIAAGINGGGKVLVGATKSLTASVNGGGDVRYSGNPSVTTAINGGGTVRRGD
jgi:hypothetical protein